jgi:hypothetical protein
VDNGLTRHWTVPSTSRNETGDAKRTRKAAQQPPQADGGFAAKAIARQKQPSSELFEGSLLVRRPVWRAADRCRLWPRIGFQHGARGHHSKCSACVADSVELYSRAAFVSWGIEARAWAAGFQPTFTRATFEVYNCYQSSWAARRARRSMSGWTRLNVAIDWLL